MANPAELTITYVTPNARVDYPIGDIIDTSGEMAIATGDLEQARLNLFAMALASDSGPQSMTIKAGDNPPAVRSALGDLVIDLSCVSAFYETELVGADNDLVFTAVAGGVYGDDITITYTEPVGNDQPLVVSVVGKDIDVSLATGGTGDVTTTAADILAAVSADVAASALVVVTLAFGNVGDGVVTAMAVKALGTAGTPGEPVAYLVGPLETARFISNEGEIVLDFVINEGVGGEIVVRVLEMPRAV